MSWLQRNEWGAKAPYAQLQRMALPVSTVFLHHTVTPVSSDPSADMRRMTNSVVPSTYVDVPYNVVVHPDGTILTGRYLGGIPALGAHTKSWNSKALAIAVLGNYETSVPTVQAISAVATVLEAFVNQGFITSQFQLRSHSDVYATACAGRNLKAQIANIFANYHSPANPIYAPIPVPQIPQPPVNNYPAYPGLQRLGSKGVFVRQIQAKLRDRGWNINVDGDFGPQTDKIVRQFQKEKRLAVDGLVGRNTWKSIFTSPVT